jgi:hypothetical protein
MSPELAVVLAAAAFVLMVGITLGAAAVVGLDAAVVWPVRPVHRQPRAFQSPGAQYWVRQDDTTPLVIHPDGGQR